MSQQPDQNYLDELNLIARMHLHAIHDMRPNAHSITGMIDLIYIFHGDEISEGVRQLLEIIKRDSRHLSTQLSELSLFNRAGFRYKKLNLERLQPVAVLISKLEELADLKKIEFEPLSFDPNQIMWAEAYSNMCSELIYILTGWSEALKAAEKFRYVISKEDAFLKIQIEIDSNLMSQGRFNRTFYRVSEVVINQGGDYGHKSENDTTEIMLNFPLSEVEDADAN